MQKMQLLLHTAPIETCRRSAWSRIRSVIEGVLSMDAGFPSVPFVAPERQRRYGEATRTRVSCPPMDGGPREEGKSPTQPESRASRSQSHSLAVRVAITCVVVG